MKILISSIVYEPEPLGLRAHDLAVGLTELGHEVVAITGLPSYPLGKIYPGYRMKPWQWERIDGVSILRIPYIIDRSRVASRRVVSYAAFSMLTTAAALIRKWRPDVAWTNQVGYPGMWLQSLRNIPLVHEVQDMWPEWGHSANLGIKSWLYNLLDHQQMTLYQKAKRITVISKGFKRWLVSKGVAPEKIEVVPNWADHASYFPVQRDQLLGEEEGLQDHFNVIYTGNVGLAQGLGVVLEAAKKLVDLPAIKFVIIGDGLEREHLQNQAKRENLTNVRFLGRRPLEKMNGFMAWADVLFLHLKQDPAFEITIPSKIYAYLASGRPILAASAGDVAELIQEYGAGVTIPADNPDAMAKAVRYLYNMPANDREAFGRNALQATKIDFNRNHLIKKYENLFAEVVA